MLGSFLLKPLIFKLCHRLKVCDLNAQAYIASMINVVTLWDTTFIGFPTGNMRPDGTTFMGYSPVGVISAIGLPLPYFTAGYRVHLDASFQPIKQGLIKHVASLFFR